MNRIFISYRTSDAKKDAHRLAVDLERVFGDDQVFFDKHDLQGGDSWRASIGDALGQRPIVLVLMSPDLLGAPHPEGGRRIDRDDDPIRGELVTACGHGALIVPLLIDGMTMPGRSTLPPDLHFMSEAHALKLRTDDWGYDLQRLVVDLKRQGVQPQGAAPVASAPMAAVAPAAPVPLAALPPAPPAAAGGLTATWVVFWIAVVLWVIIVAAADEENTPAAYLGAAVVILFPLGMFVHCFRRFAAVGSSARWAALSLALLSGLLFFGYLAS
jgi:hypothetical protein